MTRTTKNGNVIAIRRRHGRYYVSSNGRTFENCWQLDWAMYRYRCAM